MTYVDYAGFDPIFWLHHAMLDRCFAIWEVLNYNASDSNTYVTPEPSRYGTYTTEVNATQDITSPLTPFHKNATGEFWTSADVPSTDIFGYAYPETASYEGQNVSANVIAAINRLYGPNVSAGAINPTGMVAERAIANATGQYTHWMANIKVSKHALGAPFFIHLFIGTVNTNMSSWQLDPNLVGTQGIFVGASVCSHCDATQMVSATLPMTDALGKRVDNGDLRSLNPNDVNAYLAGQLQYRVTLVNNTVIENGDSRLQSLNIDVAYAQVQTAGVNELPTWGDPKISFSMGAGSG
jgi:tyrosinase